VFLNLTTYEAASNANNWKMPSTPRLSVGLKDDITIGSNKYIPPLINSWAMDSRLHGNGKFEIFWTYKTAFFYGLQLVREGRIFILIL